MKERIYTEQEIAALIERTAELQAEKNRRGNRGSGLTLTELETVAAEAGLDPSLLRQAAAEIDDPRTGLLQRRSTSSTHIFTERWVQGPFNPDAWEDVVAELRHQFDSSLGAMMGTPNYGDGVTEQIGRSVTWKHTSMAGVETRVLVRPRGDKVHIRLSQRVGLGGPVAESVGYGTALAGFIAVMVTALAELGGLGWLVFLLILLVAVPVIFYADRVWRRKKHEDLETLGDRIALLLTPTSEARASEVLPEQTPVQKLDGALLNRDEEPAQDSVAARARTRGA